MKPLHVRVAEALGCKALDDDFWGDREWTCACDLDEMAEPPHGIGSGEHGPSQDAILKRYDTDWSATGPLIERLGITVLKDYSHPGSAWRALYRACDDMQFGSDVVLSGLHDPLRTADVEGQSPLMAVCNLILALKEAGKL